MLALLLLLAAQAPPPDPAGEPPPPPVQSEDPADGGKPPEVVPVPSPEPSPPPLPVDARPAPLVTHHAPSALPRPLRGGLSAAAGAGLGAAMGASFLFWGSLTPGTPELVLLLGAVATPALASFLAGTMFVAFAIARPALDDWGAVAGCTAAGCLALGLLVLGVGGGNIGWVGTGCNVPPSCCSGAPSSGGTSSSADEGAIWATASGGLGAAVGLGVGSLVGLTLLQSQPDALLVPTLAWSAGAGMVAGALVGGAIGGTVAGTRDDQSVEREAATRPAPARADRPR